MTAREVVLEGGPPWGFRMHGGADVKQPLRISRVNPGSKAAHRGIREGDLISSINGQSIRDLSNADAHGLLKTAGDTIKLGLNEQTLGSPKRRQYRTVHQETLQETVKKSSITTYSIQKTVETVETHPGKINENTLSKANEYVNANGTSTAIPPTSIAVSQRSTLSSNSSSSTPSTFVKEGNLTSTSPDNAEASQRSSYTNCTVSPSTTSTLSEDGNSSSTNPKLNAPPNSSGTMNDTGPNNSRSRRRRQRRKNRKHNENQNSEPTSPDCDKVIECRQVDGVKVEYRVDSPVESSKTKTKQKLSQNPIKSKSLDDDESVKIQELSETSEAEDKESKAIVLEAPESDVEWEDTIQIQAPKGKLSNLALTLDECSTNQVTLISPEEEQTLRSFLGGLNLVNGPEEAAKQVCEKATDAKIKKSQKRAALEQYFLPVCQNPRFLDAISEEVSDRDSDKEQPNLTRHLKQGTPELDVTDKPPAVPPRSNRDRRRRKFPSPVEQPQAVLVAKIVNNPVVEGYFSTTKAEPASTVEVVYLDSSESNSPGECDSTSNDSYVLEVSEKNSSNEDVCNSDVKVNGVLTSSEPDTETSSASSTEDLNKNAHSTDITRDLVEQKLAQNFPGSMVSKKDNLAEKSSTYEELSGKNETITTSSSTKYSFVVKTDITDTNTDLEVKQRILESGIMSQLTPPPTPENLSPKNGITAMPCSVETTFSKEKLTIEQPPCIIKSHEKTLIQTNNAQDNSIKTQKFGEGCAKNEASQLHDSKLANIKEIVNGYKKYSEQTLADDTTLIKESEASSRKPTEDSIVYTNVVSPSPNCRSPSISSSSSRDSSLCTAKYNPLNSSIADVTSISKEEELAKELTLLQPLGLRETCLRYLMTQPFGADVLQELADVSMSIESYTSTLPGTLLPKLIPAFVDNRQSDPINDSSNISVEKMPVSNEWVGLPTERDPKLLACLSPKQKEVLEKTKKVSDEAGQLIELHEKFVNRRLYQEELQKKADENVTITSVTKSSGNVSVTNPSGNRLLDIIREEPADSYLFFVEKEPSESCATLPRVKNTDDARLKAKNLSEWLSLARNKSMSESNLNTASDIPENNLRKDFNTQPVPRRRTSLPYDIYERQMIYLQEKERDIQRQLEQLEEEKRKLNADAAPSRQFQAEDYHFSRKGDFAESKNHARPTSMPSMPSEFFRQQMYEEYMDKFAEREDRKQHKVIKVTSSKDINQEEPAECMKPKEIIHPIQLENEFLEKVKQKQDEGKLGKNRESVGKDSSGDTVKDEDEQVLVMDGDKLRGTQQLPKHLQEFVTITKQVADDGIWAPGQPQEVSYKETHIKERDSQRPTQDEAILPVWTPKSANSSPTSERKEFRPVNFQSPVLGRKIRTKSENLGSQSPSGPPWKIPDYSSDTGINSSLEKRLPTSHSSPASGFGDFSVSPRLPKAQNPTITLLQKAREGQLPRGPVYIDAEPKIYRPKNSRPPIAAPGDILYQIKNEYTSESESERPRKMADLGPRKYEGIGPVSKDGMPLILRSEIKDQNQSKWYKRMYDTIHKQKPHNDEYVTVRYKQKRAQYPYSSGYLSEPEPGAYDSDFTDYKYQTLDRRRPTMQERNSDYTTSSTMPRSLPTNRSSSSDILRNVQEPYKVHPGRIENYTPGHSSISEKEAKEWWDEVMDIFDGHLEQQKRVPPQPRSFINQALKESGYESDSTLVFRRREEAAQQLSPKEQKAAYKVIQKGGDVPLQGLRKLAPERPKESPRKYVENEVTIHYKTPVRQEIKEYLSEDELAYRQAEAMKKIYQEERRKKHLQVSKSLQELQDMNSRRHTDNFIPSQKSPISLNRYDDFDDLAPSVKPRPRSPEPRLVARALYNFVGQTARELTFRKGDLIYVRRQVDKNWYEGELNAMVGLFPTNYVEIVPYDGMKSTPRKSHEGQARAKYNFVAQTHLELSLAKGELVVITRRVDDNWFEGKIGGRKGIFPASYAEVLIDPQDPPLPSSKPVAAPAAHSLLLNGSAGGKDSMGTHCYTPSLPNPQLAASYHAKPVQVTATGAYGSLGRPLKNAMNETLHIETQSEPVPYRALYKYNPQNEDELELLEGDTVYVLEKCDDGWYVGSSNRTGAFGTFPGNYVEKI